MKRFMVATATAGIVFGSVWALAATLNVGFATAATGQGTVGKCGDVTGSTFLVASQTYAGDGRNVTFGSVVAGPVTDITKTDGVNIEMSPDCVVVDNTDGTPDLGVNVFVQVKAGSSIVGSGQCDVQSHGGFSFNESDPNDNVPGCTVLFAATNIAPIDALVVTTT